MTARTPLLFKTVMALTCSAILATAAIVPVQAEPDPEATLLRVEIQHNHGESVKISVPLSLIDAIYAVMPKEIHEACVELELTPETILKELATLDGEDLVRMTGEEQVRVWFETITDETKADINFVTVFVKEGNEKGHEIHVKVPKGLIKLVAKVIQELDIVEECIDLPPEIRQALNKIKEKKAKAE